MSDLDDDDLARYGISVPSRVKPLVAGDDDEDDEPVRTVVTKKKVAPTAPSDFSYSQPAAVKKKKTVAFSNGGSSSVGNSVPFIYRNAAFLLLQGYTSGQVGFTKTVAHELQHNVVNKQDANAIIDPIIVIYDTLNTGSIKVYLKEAIPLSTLLLARSMNCEYVVELIPSGQATSKPKPFSLVKIKAFKAETPEFLHIQSFGCADTVKWTLEERYPPVVIEYIERVMKKIGVVSADDVLEPELLDTYTNAMIQALEDSKNHKVKATVEGGGGDDE